MRLKEGLSTECIYIPEKLWRALGWKIDDILDIKLKKIGDKNTLLISKEE